MSISDKNFQFNNVDCIDIVDEKIFHEISRQSKPTILRNCLFGDCFNKWNLDYLNDKLNNYDIVIHESECSDLNFINKNFKYRYCKFAEFTQQLQDSSGNKCVYLRSTNRNPRSKKPARIEDDFPEIGGDLKPPVFIPFGQNYDQLYHSSVLRIASSNVQIWTHFDLYDNVLCQVIGTKRVILFPPKDIEYLYLKDDKSLVDNLDDWLDCLKRFPLIKNTSPYKCQLKPGEVLFIPALWWHNIRTISCSEGCSSVVNENFSIGFNIFWKDENIINYYADSDVYGNKNLKPVDSAIANLDKAITHINKMDGKYNIFYKHFLLETLKTKLFPTPPIHDNEK